MTINVLIPMAGNDIYFNDKSVIFPKPLIEIGQKTIIERVIKNLDNIGEKINFIFVIRKQECTNFYLDSTLNVLTNNNSKIVVLDNKTQGSACSALMAIDYINNEDPLIIANSDQIFNASLKQIISNFKRSDAGVITFESVHPRWSFIKLNHKGDIIETSEKRPISKYAIAGFYFYNKGSYFVDAAFKMISKREKVGEAYYISSTLNQIILEGKKIAFHHLKNDQYQSFYTLQNIKNYISVLELNKNRHPN